jgi:hypothetical protein
MNNRTFKEQAGAFGDRLQKEAGADPGAIADLAWKYAYNRPIRREEAKQIVEFIRSHRDSENSDAAEPLRSAIEEMCLALFNTNEFIYMP